MRSHGPDQPASFSELVVYDELQPCPYLPGRQARMPLRLPKQQLTPDQFDECLAAGDRRYGTFLYRTRCPSCQACEPMRIPVADFEWTRRHRRIARRNDDLVECRLGPPLVDQRRLALFNGHRARRDLRGTDAELGREAYQGFLVNTCCQTLEMSYYRAGRLVAVGIIDRGREALSAVYTFFDPDESRLSLGVYSILKQIELCRHWRMRFLYLGLYVADCSKMAYKAEYLPHERLIGGRWRRFDA